MNFTQRKSACRQARFLALFFLTGSLKPESVARATADLLIALGANSFRQE